MENRCDVIITRGKNKGKTCGEVNSRCKHVNEPMICATCGASYTRSTSYYRHLKQHESGSSVDANRPVTPASKIKVCIKKKAGLEDVHAKLERLERQNQTLREEMDILKQTPMTTNYIAIVGTNANFYNELTQKLGGKEAAISFLTNSCVKGEPISVFQKLYLEGKQPNVYPVACKDNLHFRYLGSNREIIDDQGGKIIGRTVTDKITDAILTASNDVITEEVMDGSNSIYNMIDLASVQQGLSRVTREAMIKDLAVITANPNHPFFRDQQE